MFSQMSEIFETETKDDSLDVSVYSKAMRATENKCEISFVFKYFLGQVKLEKNISIIIVLPKN